MSSSESSSPVSPSSPDHHTTEPPAPAPANHAKTAQRRTLWMVIAGVAAFAIVGGIGVAVGAFFSSNSQAGAPSGVPSGVAAAEPTVEPTAASTEAAPRGGSDSTSPVDGDADPVTIGAVDAAGVIDIVDRAASAGAKAEDVIDIDAKLDGTWEVGFETAAGDETEIRVNADGTADVLHTERADDDDRRTAPVLTRDVIASIVDVALAEVPGGRIFGIESDDSDSPFEVSLQRERGVWVDLDLSSDLRIVHQHSSD